MPIKHLESLQPALAELERAVVWAGRTVDDIPFKLVPVIQTKGRKSKCAGWYSPDQWSTREGEEVHEITFCAEELNQDPVTIVAIAVHEVVHYWVNFLQLKDVSTGGRHNKVFKEYAEISGLKCAQPYDSYGYGYTTPTDELRERIEKEFQPNVAAFNLFRLVKPSTVKPVKTNAWICLCDKLTLRIPAQQTLDATCHKCDTKFIPKNDEAAAVERDLPPIEPPKKVKKHKHKDGLPEHEENVPYHEHKEGEGHIIPEAPTDEELSEANPLTAEENKELVDLFGGFSDGDPQEEVDPPVLDPQDSAEEPAEAPESLEPPDGPPDEAEGTQEPAERADTHLHTEDFPFHSHGDVSHGNEEIADDPNLDHEEDVSNRGLPDVEDEGLSSGKIGVPVNLKKVKAPVELPAGEAPPAKKRNHHKKKEATK